MTTTTPAPPVLGTSVEDYMQRPYVMAVVWDEDYWAATFPELPGLVAAANTWDELERNVEDAKFSYFQAALEAGLPIPEPGESGEPASGRVLLRLPKSLHRQAARAALRDGVSVNMFLVSAIAKELGRREATPQSRNRVKITHSQTPMLESHQPHQDQPSS
jgi:antitoxin HicB